MAGFFWEDHILFVASFFLTKLVELSLYVLDPTIEGVLPLWQFILLFVPSFLGYGDGYQDATAIVIARQCALDHTADVNHHLAGTLAESMALSFWIGVFLMQWVLVWAIGVIGYLRDFDPSLAVLAKLVHMDALCMCLSVPNTWALALVNAIRTLCEDIPQAGQQTVYVLYVKENVFMIVSIGCSVACSLKALQDTLKRAALAVGLEEKMLDEYEGDESKREEEKRNSAAITIQKMWRGRMGRSRFAEVAKQVAMQAAQQAAQAAQQYRRGAG